MFKYDCAIIYFNNNGAIRSIAFLYIFNNMRLYISLLAFFVFFSSCKTKTPVFRIDEEVSFTIPAGLSPLLVHHFQIKNVKSLLSEVLEENKMDINAIDELYAGKGKFVSFYNNSNYGIIDKVSVWINKSGEEDNQFEIYYLDEVPLNRKGELKLLSSGQDIREVLLNERYDIDIEVRLKYIITEPIESRFIFSYVAYDE